MKGIPGIKEFPSDNQYWRVDWFGAIQPNPKVAREPALQVIITPFKTPDIKTLTPNKLASASSSLVDYNEQRTIQIGTGQLPMLCIGSIWRNNEFQPQLAGQVTEFNSLEISERTTRALNASSKEQNQYIIPFSHYRFGKDGFFSKMVAIEHEGDPYGILVPMAELVRFYYAVSTDLADVVFSGDLKHNLHSVLNMEHTWSEPEDDREVIGLRQRFSDEDGWVLARIMNSPEAWAGATAVHDEMLKNRFNGKPSHIESAFPFSGLTNLTARCKLIPTKDPKIWRYLVLSLVRCTAAFPFRHLTVYRDNDNRAEEGKDKPDNEKKPGWAGPKVIQGNQDKDFQSQQAPNKNSAMEVFNLPTDRFGDIAGKEPDKPSKEQCEYKSVAAAKPPVPSDQLSSAQGDDTDSTTGSGRLNSTYERAKALPASFDTFIKAIEHLNTFEGFSAKIREPDELTRYIPLTKPGECWQWSYLDSHAMLKRRVIIADVTYNNSSYNLIEFEQRATENFKVVLIKEKYRSLEKSDLFYHLAQVAKNKGVWDKIDYDNSVLEQYTLKHVWHSEIHYSESIKVKISLTEKSIL